MLCVVLLQLVTRAKNAPIRRCFELAHIFPPCTVITCVVHPCELLAAHSLPGAKAPHIGRITRLHYLSLGAEEGSISGASRQNYLSLLFREHHEAVTMLLECRGLWYNGCWRGIVLCQVTRPLRHNSLPMARN